MIKKKFKKIFCRTIVIIYLISLFFQDFFYVDFGKKVYAAEVQQDHVNIVAILVDDNIYNSIDDEIEWYAKDYIQGATDLFDFGNIFGGGNSGSGRNSENSGSIIGSIGSAIMGLFGGNNSSAGTSSTSGNAGVSPVGNNEASNGGTNGGINGGINSIGGINLNGLTGGGTGNSTGAGGGGIFITLSSGSRNINLANMSLSTNYNKYNSISDSIAIVLKVDTDNITAPEITKILENLYFDGIKDVSSNLVGLILIGDIPLPVVNQNGYIYPTIYPYVDFEEQKFVWDDASQYFVYNDKKNGQAEIWHSLIKFDNIQQYKDYFEKLQEYAQHPSSFIGKNIWYEDFVGNKKYFFSDGLNSYINTFLFAEDLGYERYSDLMVSIMQGAHNEAMSDVLSEMGNILSGANYSGDFSQDLTNFLASSSNDTNTPTLMIKKILDEGYLSSYTSLLGTKYIDTINKNVSTANRWIESFTGSDGNKKTRQSLDSHYMKIEQKDETLLRRNGGFDPFLISLNNVLEEFVDTKVESEKYWLNEVIPLTYLNYMYGENTILGIHRAWTWKRYNAYENFLFGQPAESLKSMQNATIYRGTYRNYQGISGLRISDIQNSSHPATDVNVDLNKKSVGGSYEIFAQQVEANRGYNINNSLEEYETYENNKVVRKEGRQLDCPEGKLFHIGSREILCWVKRRWTETEKCEPNKQNGDVSGCESMTGFTYRYRGGASPLNLTGNNANILDGYNYKNATSSLYDIAGSTAVTVEKTGTDSFEAINQYSALQQKKFVGNEDDQKLQFTNKDKKDPVPAGKGYDEDLGETVKFTNWTIDTSNGRWSYSNPLTANSVDYFTRYNEYKNSSSNKSAKIDGNIVKITFGKNNFKADGRAFTYKTLDSRVKNNASTRDQIYDREYKVFKDEDSPIYQSYLGLSGRLNELTQNLDNSPLSLGSGSVHPLMNEIRNALSGVNAAVNSVKNITTSQLSNLSTGEIQEKVNLLNDAYSSDTWDMISGNVSEIQEGLSYIDTFTTNFDFYNVEDYLNGEISKFATNNWDLVYYYTRTVGILSKLSSIKSGYESKVSNTYINNWTSATRNKYNQITGFLGIFNNINSTKSDLTSAVNTINSTSAGCSSQRYTALCQAITRLRNNLNDYGNGVSNKIGEIASFEVGIPGAGSGEASTGLFKLFGCASNTTNCVTISGNMSSTINSTYNNVLGILSGGISVSVNHDLTKSRKGMNITTSDRPIDSPKYLTFKGIGGDKVTFIYPDLYKVEVFTGRNGNLTLLEPDQISDNIKKYLRDVVKKYNYYLTGQDSKHLSYYNQNSGAYNLLNQLDKLASPNHVGDNYRRYQLFDEDYLIDKLEDKINSNLFFSGNMGGMDPIDFIAHMIYYQNIEWPSRSVGNTIQDDMDNIRQTFDINQKISHIMENYLISDNNQGGFLTPGYRDDGYEVAYINSDESDYITYNVENPLIESIKSSSYQLPKAPESIEKTQLEDELLNECNIPDDGVLLFDLSTMSSPWYQAVKCRWEKIKQKPLSLNVSINRDFGGLSNLSGSFGGGRGIGGGDWTSTTNRGDVGGEIGNRLNSFGNNIESFISGALSDTSLGDISISALEQMGILVDTNNEVLNNASSGDYRILSQINSNVKVKSQKTSINADDPKAIVSISSNIDIGDVDFYLLNVGNNKIKLSNTGLVSMNITRGTLGYSTGHVKFNPFEKQLFELELTTQKAGTEVLVVYMCINETNDMNDCIKKTIKYTVIPGEIAGITIESIGDTMLQGSKMPIAVKGIDVAGNNVGQIFSQNFNITVSSGGSLSYQSTNAQSISFSDFDKSNFVLNSNANGVAGPLTISVSGNIGGTGGTIAQKAINVVKGKLNITSTGSFNNNVISSRTIPSNLTGGNTTGLIVGGLIGGLTGGTIGFGGGTTSGSIGGIGGGLIGAVLTGLTNLTGLTGGGTVGNLGGSLGGGSLGGSSNSNRGNTNSFEGIQGIQGSNQLVGGTTQSPVSMTGVGNTLSLNIYLPDENIYSYVDDFGITQINTGGLPQLKLRLTNLNGSLLSDVDAIATVSSRKGLVKIGDVVQKTINKNTATSTYQVIQNKFSQTANFVIQSGVATVYLLPNFKVGTDEILVSIPGITPITINVNIHSGSPKVVKISSKSNNIKIGSEQDATISIFDNWENIVTNPVSLRFGSIGPISISGYTNNINLVQVQNGTKEIKIIGNNEGGMGYIYGLIDGVQIDNQKPGYLDIFVQDSLLPETGLNVMYLNLFGSDRGNQWGFMSDNDKYVQNLIVNSDKLLTTTTLLISPEKIKSFEFVVNKNLEVSNIGGNNINLLLKSGLNIGNNNIGYIGTNRTALSQFNIYNIGVSTSNAETLINSILSNNSNNNILLYVPESTDSIITGNEIRNNSIYINGVNVFDINNCTQNNNLSVILSNDKLYGRQSRNVYFRDKMVGNILIVVNNKTFELESNSLYPDFAESIAWLGGSTNNSGLGIFEINSSFGDDTLGYQSIQNSLDPSLGIGFTANFKNITNFGAGESVGEATLPFSSEFLINIGDPLLKRINDNETAKVYSDDGSVSLDTEFDKGLGEIIYSDPGKTIYKVINIDFNNDNLEDILVSYTDGTIKLLKNYGGNTPFQNLGDLMVLADGIKDIIIGDVDGNNYQDIIIWTKSDILRVYHNNNGVFDVDGYPICININVHAGEISAKPEKIDGLFQIFFEDMDNDGSMDIVTLDHLGYIKIFYGGKTNSFRKDNYVSDNKYMCDSNWYARLSNNGSGSTRNINLSGNTFIAGGSGFTAGGSGSFNMGSTQGIAGSLLNLYSGTNMNSVYRFAAKINSNVKVLDNSLVRRYGINSESNTGVDVNSIVDTSEINGNGIVPSGKVTKASQINKSKLLSVISSAMNFDVSAAEEQYKLGSNRYQVANFGKIPVYESGIIDENDIEYVNIGRLTGSDPIITYKKYQDLDGGALEDGDKVEVTVTLQAKRRLTGTYIDIISGPWILPIDEELGMIENFWFESGTISPEKVNNQLKFHRDLENGRYMIDNIGMNSGDIIKYHYRLYYDGTTQITEISLKDVNGNNYDKYNGTTGERISDYPSNGFVDIKTQPTDGCNASMFVFFNEGTGHSRQYHMEYINLGDILGNISDTAEESYENSIQELAGGMTDILGDDNKVNLSSIPGGDSALGSVGTAITDIFSETFNLNNILADNGVDLSNILNIPNQIIDSLLGDVTEEVEDIVSKSCGGFDLGTLLGLGDGNCGLPVPFNEAFLGPGNYHLFGCFDLPPLNALIGDGMPLLNIPGNWGPTPVGYIPAPGLFGYPAKVSGADGFDFGNPVGTYPSFFRLYVMPTLTAEIGFALCFGPYAITEAIPEPFSSLGGNCVVFTVPLPCKGASDITDPTETYPPDKLESLSDIKACDSTNQPNLGPNESNSPTQYASSNDNMSNMTNAIPGIGGNGASFNNGSYLGGFINIEKTPTTSLGYESERATITIGGEAVSLIGGADSPNKILGSKAQGLIEKIVKSWLDKQIKYMFNNLTNFKVGVTFPDFENIFGGRDTIASNFSESKNAKNNETPKQKCENKGKQRINGSCVSKINASSTDKGLEAISKVLPSRGQIQNLDQNGYTNLLENAEAAFKDVNLINLTTQDITITVPMITTEDIESYISLSKNWIDRQSQILEQWKDTFYGVVSFCGGEKVDSISSLKSQVRELKNKLERESKKEIESLEKQISDIDDSIANASGEERKQLETKKQELQKRLENEGITLNSYVKKKEILDKLNQYYDFSSLGWFNVLERKDGKYLIQLGEHQFNLEVMPVDIYLLYDPAITDKSRALTMYTNGVSMDASTKRNGKIIINSIKKTGTVSNPDLGIVSTVTTSSSSRNKCADFFLGGSFDIMLNNFLSIESSAGNLTYSVKQNLETLELYREYPMKLYEWMHVTDEYLAEISNFVNTFLSSLSIWMETNANRYSQYVNAIITLMTTLETYQAIIDLSADWSESCSTCSNDNYDQFACKLGLICPDGILPTLAIPPMKIPSIYLDFSNINLGTEIRLPNFHFVTNSIPLPNLPDLPTPPKFDFSMDFETSINLGIDVIGQFMMENNKTLTVPNLGSIPAIPEPPELPNPPSFTITSEVELPILPPAPKIPKLPNEITAAINTAKTIGKILCIVKRFPLVNEQSVKAKVEQMSQRTYEVPYWDTMDQTFSTWGDKIVGDNSWISEWLPFMNSSEFKDAKLKGFDISVESYINLQYDFSQLDEIINEIVSNVNNWNVWDDTNSDFFVGLYNMVNDISLEELANNISNISTDITQGLQKCIDNPFDENCQGIMSDNMANVVQEYNNIKNRVLAVADYIKDGFPGISKHKQEIINAEEKAFNLEEELNNLATKMEPYYDAISRYQRELNTTNSSYRILVINAKIKQYQDGLSQYEEKVNKLTNELQLQNEKIEELNEKYGEDIQAYDNAMTIYNTLYEQYTQLNDTINDIKETLLAAITRGGNAVSSGVDAIFDTLSDLSEQIQSDMDMFNNKQEIRKQQRQNTLQGLYDESNTVGYINYNDETNKQNMKILADSLNAIKDNTTNSSILKKVNSSLKLIQSDTNIYANNDGIDKIQKEYSSILNTISDSTDTLSNMIANDYDNFLYAVSNNNTKLVSNNDINLTISAPLFNMDNDVKQTILDNGNIDKMVLDYYSGNINGYINALENNSAKELNMSEDVYNMNKQYLYNVREKTELAYNVIDSNENNILLAQNISNGSNNQNNNQNNLGLSTYFDGQIISTPEGGFMLSNSDFTNKFQGNTLMVDINKDNKNDLILWDDHNIYIKYRNNHSDFDKKGYKNKYYLYSVSSYDSLLNSSSNNGGYISISDIDVKLCDNNWEVKNFVYMGGDFDDIRISRSNSDSLGDILDGYLVKLIHRYDLYNDKENIVNSSNRTFFDKKYILVLPVGSQTTGMSLKLPKNVISLDNEDIFNIYYYNDSSEKISLIVGDVPRNWQYAEIYPINRIGSLYFVSGPSSNQIVGGPQIIADDRGPDAEIQLYRPSTNTIIDNGEYLEGFISTNYTLGADWIDDALLNELWISDEDGTILEYQKDIFTSTGHIELTNLKFDKAGVYHYYFVGNDINGNMSSSDVTLTIKIPNINIVDIQKVNTGTDNQEYPVTVSAEISQDLDEGIVQFLRQRNNNIREILTGNIGGISSDKYNLQANQTIITGGYYDFGSSIGLYMTDGSMAAKLYPSNGKIEIQDGYEDSIEIQVDFANHVPVVKVLENGNKILLMQKIQGREFVSISNLAVGLTEKDIDGNQFGSFNHGKAIIENGDILLYISPTGELYTDYHLYGDYTFDDTDNTIIYSFKKSKGGTILGKVKIKAAEISVQ